MNLFCAWCFPPTKETPPEADPEGSHGICPPCAEKLFSAHQEKQAKRYSKAVEEWNNVPSYIGDRKAFNQYREEKNRHGKR